MYQDCWKYVFIFRFSAASRIIVKICILDDTPVDVKQLPKKTLFLVNNKESICV